MWWLAQGEQDLPDGVAWLTPREQQVLASFRYTKRRVEFLTRRWTAKRAVALVLGRGHSTAALVSVEIRHHASGAPWVAVDGQPAAMEVSISDRAGWAVSVVGPPGGLGGALGIDLELVEPRSDAFVGDFLTAGEAAGVRSCRQERARRSRQPDLVGQGVGPEGVESGLACRHPQRGGELQPATPPRRLGAADCGRAARRRPSRAGGGATVSSC
jgi:hypothetical protein